MNEREKIIEIIAPFISAYGEDEAVADALIAANIGDVTEYKKTICDLNMDVVAYRALSKADTLEQIIEGQKSLVNEYEHRAEVAERAFDNTMKVFHEILSAMFPDTKIDFDKWKKDNLANAEKELAEEEKNG